MTLRVTVWNEGVHEATQPEIAAIYPHGIHGAIAEGLRGLLGAGPVADAVMASSAFVGGHARPVVSFPAYARAKTRALSAVVAAGVIGLDRLAAWRERLQSGDEHRSGHHRGASGRTGRKPPLEPDGAGPS